MWNLKFIGAGREFAAIPKAARSFHRGQINEAGDSTNHPPGNVIDAFIIHIVDLSKDGQI